MACWQDDSWWVEQLSHVNVKVGLKTLCGSVGKIVANVEDMSGESRVCVNRKKRKRNQSVVYSLRGMYMHEQVLIQYLYRYLYC